MRSYPDDDDDRKEAEEMRAEPWQLEPLKLNPHYVYWGPYEDYMWKDKGSWDSRVIEESWGDFKFELDELNEVVNFYFYVERDSKECVQCDGSGYNPETKRIADSFYAHSCPRDMTPWNDKITQDELEALFASQRLWSPRRKEPKPTLEQVNAGQAGGFASGLMHDGINRYILIEARAKRLGVYGLCECKGTGRIYTAEKARLGVVFWVLHPRKGCSRGVDVKSLEKADISKVLAYLKEAADRNAARFAKAVAVA